MVFKRLQRLKITYFNVNASVLFLVQLFVYMGNESSYRTTSNISRTLVDNVVGASPVGAAPTTSSFST